MTVKTYSSINDAFLYASSYNIRFERADDAWLISGNDEDIRQFVEDNNIDVEEIDE